MHCHGLNPAGCGRARRPCSPSWARCCACWRARRTIPARPAQAARGARRARSCTPALRSMCASEGLACGLAVSLSVCRSVVLGPCLDREKQGQVRSSADPTKVMQPQAPAQLHVLCSSATARAHRAAAERLRRRQVLELLRAVLAVGIEVAGPPVPARPLPLYTYCIIVHELLQVSRMCFTCHVGPCNVLAWPLCGHAQFHVVVAISSFATFSLRQLSAVRRKCTKDISWTCPWSITPAQVTGATISGSGP